MIFFLNKIIIIQFLLKIAFKKKTKINKIFQSHE